MKNPVLLFEGSKQEFDALPIREQCAWYALNIARSVELLLKVLNDNEEVTTVSEGNEIITESDLHRNIADYMDFSVSLFGDKPE